MEFINKSLTDYTEQHTSPESELLQRINRETNLEVLMPRMLSGHLQGRVLSMLSKMVNPSYIVEVGSYTGYSALCLAEGLREGGKLVTIEFKEELEDRILTYFNESNYSESLELLIGDATTILPELADNIDLAFIDADKTGYQTYYNLLLDKLRPGGYIIADNVLWSGKVVDKEDSKDVDTAALKKFNRFVHEDERVENTLLPVRDGLMLIRKK